MFEVGLLHNDLHTENMMADEDNRLYLIDFDASELISKVGFSAGAFRNNSKYINMNTDADIIIQFTEDQLNRIRTIQANPAVKQAEIDRKIRIQKIREDAKRQVMERQAQAIKRLTGKTNA
jgi:thiamine kinase-like enzyme